MSDLSPHLTPLLPKTPARILLLGWPDSDTVVENAGHELVRVTGHTMPADETSFDAILWHLEDSGVDAGHTVAALRRHLADGGRVILVTALPANAPVVSRRQGSLPSRHQTRLREVVGRLSEAGFAFRKDLELPTSDSGPGWKVLLARRDPFIIRSYRDGDEEAILRLFQASFHLERSLDHWRWKYAANPWGSPLISLAAAEDGFAAHYGGYPIPFWRGGQEFLALQIGDTMTDPRARDTGRGKASLLARTVRHFFAVHRDGTYGLFYGFNTGPIQRFCRWFIGGSQDRAVRYLARDLEPAPGWHRRGYRVERVTTIGPAWDRLFRHVAPSYRFLVRRDAEYLSWRYLKRPDARYVVLAIRRFRRLVGWGVFLRRDDAIVWGDALFRPRHFRAAEPLLAAALTEPELAGARRIEAWFSGGPAGWDERLEQLGFRVQPEPQGLGLIALGDAEPEAFDHLDKMYTTMGDGDLF